MDRQRSRNASLFCYQLALAPENLITFAHLSDSSAMRSPYSMGERASTIAPRSAKRVFNLNAVARIYDIDPQIPVHYEVQSTEPLELELGGYDLDGTKLDTLRNAAKA